MARPKRTPGWSIALLLATALLGWLWLLSGSPSGSRREAGARGAAGDSAGPSRSARDGVDLGAPAGPRPSAPRAPSTPRVACAPRASRSCQAGDVYWLDACGQRGEKAEECGARLCKGETCEPIDPRACAGLPLEGTCDGDVVRGCLAGWPFERDCRALGQRGVIGEEGAVCRKPSPDDCERHGALPRCDGNTLIACFEGKRIERDCGAIEGARCELLPQTKTSACVATRELDRPPRERDPCGPCGCPGGPPVYDEETCNGRDDDGDAIIDEEVSCEPLDVVAYVIGGAGGSSYAREDIEREIASVNAIFDAAGDGLSLRVQLADFVELAQPEFLRVDDENFGRLLGAIAARSATAASLQVPIVFTDEIISEDAPKAGISTIPNGSCGGVRRTLSPQPPLGMVIVAKRRAPTTVAHELGHFLGLCHTHESDPPAVVQTARYRGSDGDMYRTTCDATCALQGDAICDTAFDPGPEGCSYDRQCIAHCATGAAPSTRNLMSYYTECRDRITPEQTIELARSRALLEGFHRCAVRGDCPCTPGLPGACPEQMTCRPEASGLFACGLDGAFAAGEACRAHEQCGAGLACLAGQCAAPPVQ